MNGQSDAALSVRPQHIAVVMDGNGRWASAQRKSRLVGHKRGFLAAQHIVKLCAKRDIAVLTLFTFSSENWQRPKDEVRALLRLLETALTREIDALHRANIRLRFIGCRQAFTPRLIQLMDEAESKTATNTGMVLVLAVNYGGRWDIVNAAERYLEDCQRRGQEIGGLTEAQFSQYLSLSEYPSPDLLIRTSGEMRLSNFFLWQMAYTELYFADCFWPDFDEQELENALASYARRTRRFGKTNEQLESKRV